MSGGSTEQLYMRWIEKCTDAELLSELESIRDQPDAISDRFYCGLSFGTGGLRGEIGAGENRMNIYTIGKATQGLAEYLKEIAGHPLVAIAHDNRRNSDVFAERAAAILAENGIRVFMYPVLTPTPMLSYAVRYYHANAGIVITASHNPAVYNGYKVYGPDGCQITDAAAEKIERHIASVDIFDDVRTCDFEQAVSEGIMMKAGRSYAVAVRQEDKRIRVSGGKCLDHAIVAFIASIIDIYDFAFRYRLFKITGPHIVKKRKRQRKRKSEVRGWADEALDRAERGDDPPEA